MFFKSCKLFVWVLIIVFTSCAKPVASFVIDQKNNTAPAKVKFDNLSKKSDSYFWDFGDGTTSQEIAPTHRYLSSGNYEVKLKAIKNGKHSFISKNINIQAPQECLVELETSLGSMTILLYNETPKHRDNFIKLAENNFYDNTLFHRVMAGFMVQGGDPDSKRAKPNQRLGTGGPSYTIEAEFNNNLLHIKGALAAARTPDEVNPQKASSGSQFYLVHGRTLNDAQIESFEHEKGYLISNENKEIYKKIGGTPQLDREYTVFGKVIEGLEVIDKIAGSKTDQNDRPEEDVKILKLRIIK